MSEPVSGTAALGAGSTLGGGTLLVAIFGHLYGPTVIGAFAGAIVFVMGAADFSLWRRIILGFVALVAGLLAAPFTLSLLIKWLPADVAVDSSVAAMVSSAAVVPFLMAFSKDGPFWSRFLGGRQ